MPPRKAPIKKSCTEKKRRQRFSALLEDLTSLLPQARSEIRRGNQPQREQILLYAVEFLRSKLWTEKNATPANSDSHSAAKSYEGGYRRCMQEILYFFAHQTPSTRQALPKGLVDHLIRVLKSLSEVPNAHEPSHATALSTTSGCAMNQGPCVNYIIPTSNAHSPQANVMGIYPYVFLSSQTIPLPTSGYTELWRPWS